MPQSDNIERKKDEQITNINKAPNVGLWLIGSSAVIGASILTAVALGFAESVPAWVSFLTGSLLNLLLLVVVVVQAYIYGQQRQVMHDQWEAMQNSLDETRKLVSQNERMVKAAEESAKIAREAFYVGEAPYFGITEIILSWIGGVPDVNTLVSSRPELVITFMNGGKTPAWHFSVLPHMRLGDLPNEGRYIGLDAVHDHQCPDAENTFYPSGIKKCIKYRGRDEISPKEFEAIFSQRQRLFLVIDIGYTDMRNIRETRTLLRRFNPITRRFGDATIGEMT